MSGEPVRIKLNGEGREVPAGTLLTALLESLSVDSRRIAVERNGEVVPRSQHAAVVVADGDSFEVVAFVGGG